MHLLRTDAAAALLAGVATAVLAPVLAHWYRVPVATLQAVALANLVYGAYSGWLLTHPCPRPLWAIQMLALANAAWVAVCLALAACFRASASGLGLGHLLFEAVFVGSLAVAEWRHRYRLQTQP